MNIVFLHSCAKTMFTWLKKKKKKLHECIENIKSLIAHAGNASYDILFNLCFVHIQYSRVEKKDAYSIMFFFLIF